MRVRAHDPYSEGVDRAANSRARAALRLWDDFPVDAHPRPLVLTVPPVTGPDGFTSSEGKIAFMEGAIAPGDGIRSEILKALDARDVGEYRGHILRVLSASGITAPFCTDRGPRNLPAWAVRLSETHGTLAVLDPQVQATAWLPAGMDAALPEAASQWGRLDQDGRSLTLAFIGSPRVYADYPRVDVFESRAAVVVCPVEVDKSRGARRGHAELREVSVRCRSPSALAFSSPWRVNRSRSRQTRRTDHTSSPPTDYVFTTGRGTPIEPRNMNRHFDRLCASSGVRRIRSHDLRHSCASLLWSQDVPWSRSKHPRPRGPPDEGHLRRH
jgi:hypothetical protein